MKSKNNIKPTLSSNVIRPVPSHIAIIMDGNRRWANLNSCSRSRGHKRGSESVRKVMNACRELDVRYLTIYAFSYENWQRSSSEVDDLFELLNLYIQSELTSLIKEGVCLRVIGELDCLPDFLKKNLKKAVDSTKHNTQFFLTVALSYGSQQELAGSIKQIVEEVMAGNIKVDDITTDLISNHLYTHSLPNPDLLIRTGGEKRLSNFLLWQLAYAELYFSHILWPDFNEDALRLAVKDYQVRERRYGAS